MLINSLKFALRNILRHKIFSLLNIFGLAISITAFILMALYIEFELSYDRFNTNANRIYRVADDKETSHAIMHNATSAAPVGPALQADFPEVQQATRIISSESLIRYNDRLFEERKIFFADENIFSIFSFNLLKGNAASALKGPMSIVLSATMAQKYFGAEEPVGKTLSVDGKSMKVTGVVSNVPVNAHFNFDFLVSMATAKMNDSGYDWLFNNWYSDNFYTYILLPDKFDAKRLSAKLEDFDNRHRKAGSETKHHYALEQLTGIYLHSTRDEQVGPTGNLANLYIFSIVGIFILLIACINFINLSTARAAGRAKEVAVKKVTGAGRKQMILQFALESFLLTGISLLIALLLAYILLPAFNTLTGQSANLDIFSPVHIVALLVILLFIALVSGIYPAVMLSGFNPVMALKGKINNSVSNIAVRRALVVFQFAVSVVLIICTGVVYAQLQFMQQHDLGFKRSQTMVINFEGDGRVKEQYKTIRQELLRIPGLQSVTASSGVPGDGNVGGWSMDFAKRIGDTMRTELPIYLTDYGFLQQYHIPMTAGRAFDESFPEDSTESMIINETALKKLGFNSAAEAIGVKVGMYPQDAKIIGVFKDFHFESLQKKIEPLAMRILPSHFRVLSLEMSSTNIAQTIAAVEKAWKALAPQRPLEYSFLDETFNNQYKSETKFGQVFTIFAFLAIVLACLGLFGLVLFSVQQRTKEIGIRKVLGATVANIVATISKDFILLVVIAIVVASPVAWYCMHRWLQGFAYQTTINWWLFVLAAAAALLIAFLTISARAVKAALANPVRSLRTE